MRGLSKVMTLQVMVHMPLYVISQNHHPDRQNTNQTILRRTHRKARTGHCHTPIQMLWSYQLCFRSWIDDSTVGTRTNYLSTTAKLMFDNGPHSRLFDTDCISETVKWPKTKFHMYIHFRCPIPWGVSKSLSEATFIFNDITVCIITSFPGLASLGATLKPLPLIRAYRFLWMDQQSVKQGYSAQSITI